MSNDNLMTKTVFQFLPAKIFFTATVLLCNWENCLRKKETDFMVTKQKRFL
jgi:hypothetical protein